MYRVLASTYVSRLRTTFPVVLAPMPDRICSGTPHASVTLVYRHRCYPNSDTPFLELGQRGLNRDSAPYLPARFNWHLDEHRAMQLFFCDPPVATAQRCEQTSLQDALAFCANAGVDIVARLSANVKRISFAILAPIPRMKSNFILTCNEILANGLF
jgi:hypothetical protein